MDGNLIEANIQFSATCHRVPVTDGHTVSVSFHILKITTFLIQMSIQLPETCSKDNLVELVTSCLDEFRVPEEVANLPRCVPHSWPLFILCMRSCPARPIVVRNEVDRPQPRLDRNEGKFSLSLCNSSFL